MWPQYLANGARVGIMSVRRHLLRRMPDHRTRPREEALGGVHVARFAQHRIDQVALGIDRSVEVAPPSVHLYIGLVRMPLFAGFAPSLGAQALH